MNTSGSNIFESFYGSESTFNFLQILLSTTNFWSIKEKEALALFKNEKGNNTTKKFNKMEIQIDPLLPMILKDMKNNKSSLQNLSPSLQNLNIHLKTWLIECDKKLFNSFGQETYEPILNIDYLTEVANALWDLSGEIFGKTEITYRSLQNYIGDNDLEKLKIAVKRLANSCTNLPSCNSSANEKIPAIIVTDYYCKWNTKPFNEKGCIFVPLGTVINHIKKLKKPL